eukprot:gene24904-30367_t
MGVSKQGSTTLCTTQLERPVFLLPTFHVGQMVLELMGSNVRVEQLVKQHYPDAEFSASPNWRLKWKRREGFATRKRTHKKPQSYASMGRFLFKHRLNVDQVPLPFVVGDYDHTYEDKGSKDVWVRQPGSEKRITEAEKAAYHPGVHVYWQKCAWVDRATSLEWQNGTFIPWLDEHIPNDESVVFADNLDAQVQPEYLGNQKEKGRALGWSLLKGGTHWSQPVDQGAGREVKRDIDYEQNEWLENLDNLEKWENCELTASDRRVLMTWWAGAGYARTCARVDLNRYFEKSGCLLSHNVVPTTLADLQQAAEEEELLDEQEQELSDEDECSDEAAKWFIPAGYTTLSAPDAGQLNCSMVVYEDGDRRDHIMRVQDYGSEDSVPAGT